MGRVRQHHARDAVIHHADRQQNANDPAHPGSDIAERIEHAREEKGK
jgi:hypothetical protein